MAQPWWYVPGGTACGNPADTAPEGPGVLFPGRPHPGRLQAAFGAGNEEGSQTAPVV